MACGRGECGDNCGESSCSDILYDSTVKGKFIPGLCMKCKERNAQILANQTEPICGCCLQNSLLSRFKTTINNHALITPTDKLLLAFSGGAASRVALEFLLEIQEKTQQNAIKCKDSCPPVFVLGVVFVDESAVLPVSSFDSHHAIEEVTGIVLNGNRKPKELLVIPLESIFEDEEVQNRNGQDLQPGMYQNKTEKLQSIVLKVRDATYKEDLLEHFRMQVLQKVAQDHGYTKLVLGSCISRIAIKVIAGTAKGQGFSLPADIQYSDARWNVPIVFPLHDFVAKDLAFYCHINHLKTVFVPTHAVSSLPQESINSLSMRFVSMLQEENPSRAQTITRTAMKLKPFHFNNKLPSESMDYYNRRRQSSLCTVQDEQRHEVLCPVCMAPLREKDVMDSLDTVAPAFPSVRAQHFENIADIPVSAAELTRFCCTSCQRILGRGKSGEIYDLLPEIMKRRGYEVFKSYHARWMRSQIEEFLILEDDNEVARPNKIE